MTSAMSDRLTTNSDGNVVVKGSWVTPLRIITLIIDGWTWSDILRGHPELVEDDIRACLAYALEDDDEDGK